ncbi:MAG: NapC/NirT family cytochrome c [Chromatiaceae bacterium]|nr:NapC/NirT family cytochrome c [Chromatiaceae bacterium]MCP5446090.1 NapC/NirT family cytochrome c [Chromatiaceae bacterium]
MSDLQFKKPGMMSRRIVLGTTIGGAVAFFIFGIIFWGGFNTAMEATNNLEFCISCHEMEENVYKEYKPTIHYSNRTGVRATCPDCHVPDPWIHKMVRKIQASNEVFHKIMGTVDTPEKFDKHRLTMAKRVWQAMKTTDSRECRNCHNFESMNPEFQRPRARKQHLNAFETGQTCIDCHKGIAHKHVRDQLSDEELETIEAPNPEFVRKVPQLYLDGLARIEAKEKELAEAEQAAKQQAREQKIAAQKAEKERIAAAVASALAEYKAGAASSSDGAAATTGAAPSAGFGIDWSDVPDRKITLFYPGETSMEWVMTGKDHGGARPLMIGGDRCITCHDKETADMGKKMVTGLKAESHPQPDKRASIAVNVQAAHDGDNLYLRFAWDDTDHVPVPFVDGGKMDPENPMKLAVMLATDDVEYADRSGCWQTCHHDVRTMPDTPAADAASGSEAAKRLDLARGITKYLKESRTAIEVQGRRGKVRGGWDKLKSEEEVKTALAANQFMDLLRYKSGKGETEDGYILDQRYMTGGQGFEVDARNEGGNWIVVMKRRLVSDKAGDLSLAMDKVYNFGFAIHDDYSNARFHHVSLGYKLAFDSAADGIEINAVKREAAAPVAATTAAPAAATPSAAAAGSSINVDWSKAGNRTVTLLYPGETSMEWVMTGKDHGGARPFMIGGDRCTTCHDKETADMGQKMVTGAKAESKPIPGKRGSIPVSVDSTHDGEYLYLRFSWPAGEHAPAPFVDGGKMDPDNPMKLAVMFSTDAVEYADRAGCWGTCHHDNRTMPDTPDAETVAGSPAAQQLDVSHGLTKYIKESRSDIEVQGRRGKKRGGWDKLKSADELKTAADAGLFMDIVRYKSGKQEIEDGHILEQRQMNGGQGAEFAAELNNGTWSLIMKRKLKSDNPGDISLETDKVYNFGFAIHDDFSAARFHHVSLGYKLGFDNDDKGVEINAIAQ